MTESSKFDCKKVAEDEGWFSQIDGKPIVIVYCRIGKVHDPEKEDLLEEQSRGAESGCDVRFGPDGYRTIAIGEVGSASLPYYKPGMLPGQYRPGLALALSLVKAGIARYIAVERLDRLARSPGLFMEIQSNFLTPTGAEVISAEEPMLSGSALDRLMARIVSAFAGRGAAWAADVLERVLNKDKDGQP
jgi:hypothetical protein